MRAAPLFVTAIALIAGGCGRLGFAALPGDGSVGPPGTLLISTAGSDVAVFSVDLATGALTPSAQGEVEVGDPNIIGASPDGRFVYMPNFMGATLTGYAIDPADGALTLIPGLPIALPAGSKGQAARVHPSGKYLYVSYELSQGGGIQTYAVDPASGALTLLGDIDSGNAGAYFLILNPAATLLYMSSYTKTLAGYAIDPATGLLTMLPAFPSPIAVANLAGTMDPSGQFLYFGTNGIAVTGFHVDDTTGALASVPGSPYAEPLLMFWTTTDVTGAFVISLCGEGAGIYVWSRDPVTGALTPAAGSPATASELPSGANRGTAVFTPDNRFMFAGSNKMATTFDVATYTFDAATGTLADAPVAAVPLSGYANSMVLVHPTP